MEDRTKEEVTSSLDIEGAVIYGWDGDSKGYCLEHSYNSNV